jgi:hypothetical protein
MTDYPALLAALARAGVEFIVVGGVAATAHGSARTTLDLDVVYRRTAENIRRVVASIAAHHPYLRGAPPGLPFRWDESTVVRGLNFTLTTDLGAIDVLGEIAGGTYDTLFPDTVVLSLFDCECCLTLPRLIAVKRAAGRPKDREVIAELEALREEQDRMNR